MRFNSALLLAFGSFILQVYASAALAQLPSGQYHISSLNGNSTVGRAFFEDFSLRPKKIVVNPKAGAWDVKALPNGRFILSNGGAPTTSLGGQVYALLQPGFPEQWIIQRQVRSGAYTIEASHKDCGWVLTNDDVNTQVACRLLIVGTSHPPFFPPSELWHFTPVEKN